MVPSKHILIDENPFEILNACASCILYKYTGMLGMMDLTSSSYRFLLTLIWGIIHIVTQVLTIAEIAVISHALCLTKSHLYGWIVTQNNGISIHIWVTFLKRNLAELRHSM